MSYGGLMDTKLSTERTERAPEPIELLFALFDGCLSAVTPKAWKTICYIARESVGAYARKYKADHTALGALARDIVAVDATIWQPGPKRKKGTNGPGLEIVGKGGPSDLFTAVSLASICRATGLSKSSVAEAVNEAIAVGVIERRARKSSKGGSLASVYRINWDTAREWAAKKERAKVARLKRRPGTLGGLSA